MISYHRVRHGPLEVSLDATRDDGPVCGDCVPDKVHRSIEDVRGSSRVANTIIGSARPNRIRVSVQTADPPASVVSGKRGNDQLFTGDGDDSIAGGGGDDRIASSRGNDALDGGAGDDRCDAGPDTDTALNCEDISGVP